MEKSDSLSNIMSVKKTQLEMMKARDYDISEEKHILNEDITLCAFMKFYGLDVTKSYDYGKQLSRFYKHNKTNKDCNVFYTLAHYGGDKCYIPQADVQVFMHEMSENENCDSGILISSKLASNNANSILRSSNISLKYFIQHFLVNELIYNPVKHFLVPEHKVLSSDEKAEFFKYNKYALASQLPLLRVKNLHVTSKNKKDYFGDPVAKYYGMKHDDIVCIKRQNFVESVMTTDYLIYRRVENC